MRKYILILIATFLLPMCSSKPAEPKEEAEPVEKVEPKDEAKAEKNEDALKLSDKAPVTDTDWAKEVDELVEKGAGLAALADTKDCVASHNAMMKYMDTHKKRLDELSTKFRKFKHTLSPEDKAAFDKKKAADYDKQMGETIAKMAEFAQLCCNAKLPREEAFALEDKLTFIRNLQSGRTP